MSILNNLRSKNSKNESIISNLLDDLTTLEINTIIKESMSAADPPESPGLLLKGLHERYKSRLFTMLADHGIFGKFDKDDCQTFEKLLIDIKSIIEFLKAEKIRLDDNEYNRVMRMESFCKFIDFRSKTASGNTGLLTVVTADKSGKSLTIPVNKLVLDKEDFYKDKFNIYTRDLVKIKRYYDLGNEEIIMQTRFGIDGDVVTRVGRGFTKNPRQLIIDIHDKHTDLSVGYWKTLVTLVKEIVENIIR